MSSAAVLIGTLRVKLFSFWYFKLLMHFSCCKLSLHILSSGAEMVINLPLLVESFYFSFFFGVTSKKEENDPNLTFFLFSEETSRVKPDTASDLEDIEEEEEENENNKQKNNLKHSDAATSSGKFLKHSDAPTSCGR